MQSDSFDLFRSKSVLPVRRSRIRVIEWLIAAMFVITLLISSGVFLKVSNAADYRVQERGHRSQNVQAIMPGTLGTITTKKNIPHLPVQSLSDDMDDNSCELKT